jgi:hypothetical protein
MSPYAKHVEAAKRLLRELQQASEAPVDEQSVELATAAAIELRLAVPSRTSRAELAANRYAASSAAASRTGTISVSG